jgi:UrcA family protein
MVTLNLKLYAAPLALLMLAVPLSVQKANAEPHGMRTAVTAKFVYNPADSASEIYADLKRTADRACESPGQRPLTRRKADRDCAADLMVQVLKRIPRQDVAALHGKVQHG